MTRHHAGDRKEQIVSAAIHRLHAVGFEGFRLGDVAKDVGINNATLIHHFGSKVALINAVVVRFTQLFEAVAEATNADGPPHTKLARHMRSSIELMRRSPEMFAVLNEIMLRARRDTEIAQLVAIPLNAWKAHIVALLASPDDRHTAMPAGEADGLATACMAQLLGMGLLGSLADPAEPPDGPNGAWSEPGAITVLTRFAGEAS